MCVDVAFMASSRQATWIAVTLILMGAALPAVAAEEVINVILDQARVAKVPERTTTMVVGNPLIADVSVQAGGIMVVTGKGYGRNQPDRTRPDRQGARGAAGCRSRVRSIMSSFIGGSRANPIAARQNCERRITLGDTPEYFEPHSARPEIAILGRSKVKRSELPRDRSQIRIARNLKPVSVFAFDASFSPETVPGSRTAVVRVGRSAATFRFFGLSAINATSKASRCEDRLLIWIVAQWRRQSINRTDFARHV